MKKPMGKKINIIMVVIIAFCAALVGFLLFVKPEEQTESNAVSNSAIEHICELATLRCYYHDVAESIVEPDAIFKHGTFKYGYKKFWIEYDGFVEIGIDANSLSISQPNDNNEIEISVPKAKILNVNADSESVKISAKETGAFTEITTDDQAKAFAIAQENMEKLAQKDTRLILQAQDNAKEIIKNYVDLLGEQMNKQFTIVWKESKENQNLEINNELQEDSEETIG